MNIFGSIEASNILHRYDLIKNSHRLIEERSIDDPKYFQSIFSAVLDVSQLQGDVESFVRYLTSVQRFLLQQISPVIYQINPLEMNQRSVHEKIENLFYLGWVKSELFNYQSNLQQLFSNYLSKLVTKINNTDDSLWGDEQQFNNTGNLMGSKLSEYLGTSLGKSFDEAIHLDHSDALKKVKSWLFESVAEENGSISLNRPLSSKSTYLLDSINPIIETNSTKTCNHSINSNLNSSVTNSDLSSYFVRKQYESLNSQNSVLWPSSMPQLNNTLNLMETALTSSFDDHFKQKQFIVAKQGDCRSIESSQLNDQTNSNSEKSFISTSVQLPQIFNRLPPIGTKIDSLDQMEKNDQSIDVLDRKSNDNSSNTNVVSWSQIVKLTSNKPSSSESSNEFTLTSADSATKSFQENKKDLNKRIKLEALSCKVFIGGISSECTSSVLIESFASYGKVNLQWPGVEINYSGTGEAVKAGYVFVIFENEDQVKKMLDNCEYEFNAIKEEFGFYWTLTINQHLEELVEVKPWRLNDNFHVLKKVTDFSKCHCLFVGGLHGVITARILADFLDSKFGGVASVRLDLDKHSYPTGAAKVSFFILKSFGEAVEAGHIMISGHNFIKKLQLDPFIIKSNCSICKDHSGLMYCRSCLDYFCDNCFKKSHKSATKSKHVAHCRKSPIP